MKKKLTILIMSLLSSISVAAREATLIFHVKHSTNPAVVLVEGRNITEIPLDKNGNATYQWKNMKNSYARLFYGMDSRNLYAEDKDTLTFSFNGNDYKNTFEVKGTKAPVITYLNRTNLTSLNDEDFALPFDQFIQKLEQKQNMYLRLLKAANLSAFPLFEKMEQARIRYGIGAMLLMYPTSYAFLSNKSAYQPPLAYTDSLKALLKEDIDLLYLPEYKDFMIETANVLNPANKYVKGLYDKCIGEMNFISEKMHNETVRQRLLTDICTNYIAQKGISNIEDMKNIFNAYVTDKEMQSEFKQAYTKWDVSAPGHLSPDFSGVDITGHSYSLKNFKGKYVYIDLWATWCMPCRKELPYLMQLADKFKGRNITFLGLSIDKDKTKWENRVKAGGLVGTQLLIGNENSFLKDYNIDGIPRFILLNPEGRIINNNMTRPSSPEIEEVLNKLIK